MNATQVGKVTLGVAAAGGAAYGTEKLWAKPLRGEAADPKPDNGLAHVGAAALALAPAGALLALKAKSVNVPWMREALVGASVGAGVASGVTGVIEGYRGITRTDYKFIAPWAASN